MMHCAMKSKWVKIHYDPILNYSESPSLVCLQHHLFCKWPNSLKFMELVCFVFIASVLFVSRVR